MAYIESFGFQEIQPTSNNNCAVSTEARKYYQDLHQRYQQFVGDPFPEMAIPKKVFYHAIETMLENKSFLSNLDYMLFPVSAFDWATDFSVDPFFWKRKINHKTELIDIRGRGVLAPMIALQLSLTLSAIRKQNNIAIISSESESIHYAGYIYLNNQSSDSLFFINDIFIYPSSTDISFNFFYKKYQLKNKKHGILKCKNLSIISDSCAVVDEIDCQNTDSCFIYRALEKLLSEKKYEIAFLFCKDAFTEEVACAVITMM